MSFELDKDLKERYDSNKKDMENITRKLDDLLEKSRKKYNYCIVVPLMTEDQVNEMNNWSNEQGIELLHDNDKRFNNWQETLYRFKTEEEATLFKITFGGKFVDTLREG